MWPRNIKRDIQAILRRQGRVSSSCTKCVTMHVNQGNGQKTVLNNKFCLISDGQYFVTVRALNEVKYGGPLATTVCDTTPYTVDNSKPFIIDIYGITYDEDLFILGVMHNSR